MQPDLFWGTKHPIRTGIWYILVSNLRLIVLPTEYTDYESQDY